jgi:hypothetical protein
MRKLLFISSIAFTPILFAETLTIHVGDFPSHIPLSLYIEFAWGTTIPLKPNTVITHELYYPPTDMKVQYPFVETKYCSPGDFKLWSKVFKNLKDCFLEIKNDSKTQYPSFSCTIKMKEKN